jgi:uncharacterized protein (TIGR00369 family)
LAESLLPEGDGAQFEAAMAFEKVEWREGYVRLRVVLQPHHRNRQGLIHGGVVGSLLDSAGMFAGTFDPDAANGRRAVTVSTACQFIGSTQGDIVEAEGTLTRAGRSMYFSDAKVLAPETGAVLASGQGTYKYR